MLRWLRPTRIFMHYYIQYTPCRMDGRQALADEHLTERIYWRLVRSNYVRYMYLFWGPNVRSFKCLSGKCMVVGQAFVGLVYVGQVSVGQLSVRQPGVRRPSVCRSSVCWQIVGQVSVSQMFVDQAFVDQAFVGQVSVGLVSVGLVSRSPYNGRLTNNIALVYYESVNEKKIK